MLRIGIIGCGKIADQHAGQIQKIPGCAVVAACDSEELMAGQFCERFRVGRYYRDAQRMLDQAGVDVIHITTPPQSHFSLTRQCLEAGCHVYVEKPFTLYTREAETLIDLARTNNLKLTTGHNAQFTHVALRMRKVINEGFLGGAPVHMESYYCYNFGDARYAMALLGDKNHWVRALPGKLLHNIISHGVAKIAEFLKGAHPRVIALGSTSPMLKSIGEDEIVDELRVIIADNESPATAYFTFSSQMSPMLHQFRLYGPRNALIVDDDHQSLVKINGGAYKSYLNQFLPPVNMAKNYLSNSAHNFKAFLFRDFHNDAGMKCLIERFYHSINNSTPPPIPYREILLTSRIMDDIFEQISSL